jgi:hypothetical protein
VVIVRTAAVLAVVVAVVVVVVIVPAMVVTVILAMIVSVASSGIYAAIATFCTGKSAVVVTDILPTAIGYPDRR